MPLDGLKSVCRLLLTDQSTLPDSSSDALKVAVQLYPLSLLSQSLRTLKESGVTLTPEANPSAGVGDGTGVAVGMAMVGGDITCVD